jgi:hypothetical protein
MPTCEKCAHELTGSAVICRRCGFYNARRRVDEWREQRRTPPPAHRAAPETPDTPAPLKPGAAVARLRPYDSTLIPFPSVARPPAVKQPAARAQALADAPKPEPSAPESKGQAAEAYPPWRKDLTERVRQIREEKARRDQPGGKGAAEEVDRNPLIEAALRRIQRAEYLPPVAPPRPARAPAAAPAKDCRTSDGSRGRG